MKKSAAAMIAIVLLVTSLFLVYYTTLPTQSRFSLNVTPTSLRGDAIAGQMIVFLVTISPNGSSGSADLETVALSASANSSAVLIQPKTITSGQVSEIEVMPDVSSVGSNVTVAITAERAGFVQTRLVNFSVIQGDDGRAQRAAELKMLFVPWLQTNYPQFGITNATQWQGTIVSPQWLVVEHYLYFSKNWEMHVYWHVMIPPYDWARIDLRQRFNQTSYSYSFEIPDLNASMTPHSITPAESLWR